MPLLKFESMYDKKKKKIFFIIIIIMYIYYYIIITFMKTFQKKTYHFHKFFFNSNTLP